MKSATRQTIDDGTNEYRTPKGAPCKHERHHQRAFANESGKRDRLGPTVAGIDEAARACEVLLSEVGTYLDLVDRINNQALRNMVLTRAREDVKRLIQLMSRVVVATDKETESAITGLSTKEHDS